MALVSHTAIITCTKALSNRLLLLCHAHTIRKCTVLYLLTLRTVMEVRGVYITAIALKSVQDSVFHDRTLPNVACSKSSAEPEILRIQVQECVANTTLS